jgi:Fic-DOC domain mobile mystery protein B
MGLQMTVIRGVFGITPIDPDEIDGLIPTHIVTQAELNEWEQANIVDAQLWLNNKQPKPDEILDQLFIKRLHKKMFGKTWSWAGKFRRTDKNIGVNWYNISTQLKQLFEDVDFQLLHKSYTVDEVAVRLHHRLVFIHPFVNGNGRLSRLITDIFLLSHKQKVFSWGMIKTRDKDSIRKQYITALKAADKHDYSLLLEFVRT